MRKLLIALALIAVTAIPAPSLASVSDATNSGVEVHHSILRKVFVGTQKLLDKVHQKEKQKMKQQYPKATSLGIRG